MNRAAALVLVLLVSSLPQAVAHPFTEATVPGPGAGAPAGTSEVVVYFSEPVDVAFSEIRVFDDAGNRIDNRDTAYHEGELSLAVTTQPMHDGVYTATTKVLSKVDGHLVPGAFVFAVGDAIVDPALLGGAGEAELVFLPEAGARFPGLLGQTIVLGAVIASLAVWGTQDRRLLGGAREEFEAWHHGRFMTVTGIGLGLVFVSGILMIAIQTVRLGASPLDVVGTYFGTVWLARMALTAVLLGVWFAMDRGGRLSGLAQAAMLAASLALIGTTTMIGHGAASGEAGAVALDYVHNLVAAVWIGGIIYFAFALLPALARLGGDVRERMSLLLIPRFSIAFVVSVGVVIVTGPALMWFLESDVGLITESLFGRMIIAKIAIASAMVGLGGLLQFRLQREGEAALRGGTVRVHRRLRRSLRLDAALGVVLLGIVALLTNGTLPAGEIQRADARQAEYGFEATEFTGNARFDVEIYPFASGPNTILVRAMDVDGGRLYDSESIKVKVSNPSRNIAPIEVAMEAVPGDGGPAEFRGELTFGFSGRWLLEVEAQRTENANESQMINLLVKPRLADMRVTVTEYPLPEEAAPLHLVHDGAGSVWISDASAPRVWQFSTETKGFTAHQFDGLASTFLTVDGGGNVWFADTPRNQIGRIDAQTREVATVTVPKLDPLISDNTPLAIQAGGDGDIWVAILNKDRLARYSPGTGSFEEVVLPGRETLPFALASDAGGRIWYATTGAGSIGYVDPADNSVTEVEGISLESPEALLFDGGGALWVTEHTGLALSRYDPVLGTLERVAVPDPESLPFGMALDRYGNVWFAQHVIDSIGVYDPENGDILEVPVPTEGSFVQFLASDPDGDVWFAEQQGNKLGVAEVSEVPGAAAAREPAADAPGYAEVASPLIAAGIVASSLFYVKAVGDKRRLNGLAAAG